MARFIPLTHCLSNAEALGSTQISCHPLLTDCGLPGPRQVLFVLGLHSRNNFSTGIIFFFELRLRPRPRHLFIFLYFWGCAHVEISLRNAAKLRMPAALFATPGECFPLSLCTSHPNAEFRYLVVVVRPPLITPAWRWRWRSHDHAWPHWIP